MKTTTFRLPDEDDLRVRVYAQSQGMSMNAAVLELVRTALSTTRRGPAFSFTSGTHTTAVDDENALREGFVS
ncbi:MAG: hypothetical protein ACRDTA_02515 [Pseudonocardiaceae bacterium]